MYKILNFIYVLGAYGGVMWLYFSKILNQSTNNFFLILSTLLVIAVSVVFFKYAIKTIFKLLNL
jgi:hypothetical protein